MGGAEGTCDWRKGVETGERARKRRENVELSSFGMKKLALILQRHSWGAGRGEEGGQFTLPRPVFSFGL